MRFRTVLLCILVWAAASAMAPDDAGDQPLELVVKTQPAGPGKPTSPGQPVAPDVCKAHGLSDKCQAVVEVTNESLSPVIAPIQGALQAAPTQGALQTEFIWSYSGSLDYWLWDAISGKTLYIGKVSLGAKIWLNGQQSQWTQTTDAFDGPKVKATHNWNCVDDNGWRPNTECNELTGAWPSNTDWEFRSDMFTTNASNFHADFDQFWYDFQYTWQADGYGQLYLGPTRGVHSSSFVRAYGNLLASAVSSGRGGKRNRTTRNCADSLGARRPILLRVLGPRSGRTCPGTGTNA